MFLPLAGIAQEARLTESARFLTVSYGSAELNFDKGTGQWLSLKDRASEVMAAGEKQQGTLDLWTGSRWLMQSEGKSKSTPRRPAYIRHQFAKSDQWASFEIVSRHGDWDVLSRFKFMRTGGTILRGAEYNYRGPEPEAFVKVGRPRFRIPGIRVGDPASSSLTVLSEFPPQKHPLSEMKVGRAIAPGDSRLTFRSALVRNEKRNWNLVTAFYSNAETARIYAEEGKQRVDLLHEVNAWDRLRPGLRFSVGQQLFSIVRGSKADALRAIQDFYQALDVKLPADRPGDASSAVIYSAHVGGTIGSFFKDVGGFKTFSKMIPYFSDLGANTLWLLPFWHGRVYAPDDYYRLDSRLGTEKDLRGLADVAHQQGMRVLGDLIPHGPRDDLGFSRQHPELVCRDEEGNLQFWWGCLYCDYANPGWQKYMADHAAYWVRKCGLDGYRVDVAGGGPPNWRPYGRNRPSFSGLFGGLRLLAAVRKEIKKANPRAVLLPEAAGPYYYTVAEYAYDWPLYNTVTSQGALTMPTAQWVAALRQYLEYQRHEFPPGATPMRFLENHDTVRARMRFGVGLHRALLALCALIRGVPLLYHEQETGDEAFLRGLYRVRRQFRELTEGEAFYTAVRAAPGGILAFLRKVGNEQSIVAINFTPQTIRADLSLDGKVPGFEPGQKWSLFEALGAKRLLSPGRSDAWSSRELRSFSVELGPYESAVLVIRPWQPAEPPKRSRPEVDIPHGNPLKVTRSGNQVRLENGWYEARINGERGGLLESLRLPGPGGRELLRECVLSEKKRKLFIGTNLLDFGKTVAALEVKEAEGTAEIRASGTIDDSFGRPVLNFVFRYTASSGPQIHARCEFEPRVNVGPAQTDLALRLRFAPTSNWLARTAEGPLWGDCIFRHPSPRAFVGRYWHGSGQAFYLSDLYPLHPEDPIFGVFDSPASAGLLVHAPGNSRSGFPTPVSLVEDKQVDSPREVGGPAAATARIPWVPPGQTLLLRKGKRVALELELEVMRTDKKGVHRRLARPARKQRDVEWIAGSSNYTLANAQVEAVIGRGNGGTLRSFCPRKEGAQSLIAGSLFYSDYGLYGEWRDPRGGMHRMNANNSEDPEPGTRFRLAEKTAMLQFTSFFRGPIGHGRSLLSPRTQYQVEYELSRGPSLLVQAAARPLLAKPKTSAFLAQTIRLVSVHEWSVNRGPWQALPEKGRAVRLWESRKKGRLPQSFALRNADTGATIQFRDFKAGSGVQNIFLHGGKGQATLFFAFLDGESVDVGPVWRRVEYRIQLGAQP